MTGLKLTDLTDGLADPGFMKEEQKDGYDCLHKEERIALQLEGPS